MLFIFPPDTFAVAASDYDRPYENPIDVQAGDIVRPVTDGSMETDFMGWTWCVGSDWRAGWTPDSWCQPMEEGWRMLRDFSALELTVRTGDRLRLLHSESGFLFCETDTGERAWVPERLWWLQRKRFREPIALTRQRTSGIERPFLRAKGRSSLRHRRMRELR